MKFNARLVQSIEEHVCRSLKTYTLWKDKHYELEWIDIQEGDVYERIYILEHKLDQLYHPSSNAPTSASQKSVK